MKHCEKLLSKPSSFRYYAKMLSMSQVFEQQQMLPNNPFLSYSLILNTCHTLTNFNFSPLKTATHELNNKSKLYSVRGESTLKSLPQHLTIFSLLVVPVGSFVEWFSEIIASVRLSGFQATLVQCKTLLIEIFSSKPYTHTCTVPVPSLLHITILYRLALHPSDVSQSQK